jgi:hypothetical protein
MDSHGNARRKDTLKFAAESREESHAGFRGTTSASELARREAAEMPQRMLDAVLDRVKCEAEQRAKERACEGVANACSLQRLQLTNR